MTTPAATPTTAVPAATPTAIATAIATVGVVVDALIPYLDIVGLVTIASISAAFYQQLQQPGVLINLAQRFGLIANFAPPASAVVKLHWQYVNSSYTNLLIGLKSQPVDGNTAVPLSFNHLILLYHTQRVVRHSYLPCFRFGRSTESMIAQSINEGSLSGLSRGLEIFQATTPEGLREGTFFLHQVLKHAIVREQVELVQYLVEQHAAALIKSDCTAVVSQALSTGNEALIDLASNLNGIGDAFVHDPVEALSAVIVGGHSHLIDRALRAGAVLDDQSIGVAIDAGRLSMLEYIVERLNCRGRRGIWCRTAYKAVLKTRSIEIFDWLLTNCPVPPDVDISGPELITTAAPGLLRVALKHQLYPATIVLVQRCLDQGNVICLSVLLNANPSLAEHAPTSMLEAPACEVPPLALPEVPQLELTTTSNSRRKLVAPRRPLNEPRRKLAPRRLDFDIAT
jgi:hypothetical protein